MSAYIIIYILQCVIYLGTEITKENLKQRKKFESMHFIKDENIELLDIGNNNTTNNNVQFDNTQRKGQLCV